MARYRTFKYGKIRDKARHVTNPKYRVSIHFYTGWIPASNLHHTAEWASLPSIKTISGMKANLCKNYVKKHLRFDGYCCLG